jgi:hypothetical protein
MHIAGLFENITIKDLKPPKRNDIVKRFVEALEKDVDIENENERKMAYIQHRKPFIRKSPSPSFVAFKMSHLKVDDLWYFLGYCKEAKHFSKCWWFSLDTKKKRVDNYPVR